MSIDREKLAAWMYRHGYATGHGDTVDDLLRELEWQIKGHGQQPVAWGWRGKDGQIRDCIAPDTHAHQAGAYSVPLYTAPPHITLEAAARQALESIDWLRHHLTQHHGCLHMQPTQSGIPSWLDKTERTLREALEGKA